MEAQVEPTSQPCPSFAVAVERDTGIEPAFLAWEASVLPLYESRTSAATEDGGRLYITIVLRSPICLYGK